MAEKYPYKEIDLNNIKFHDSNKHISALSFDSPGARYLEGAKPWNHIPSLCVLTGNNGSGKSHLLHYINELLESKQKIHAFQFENIFIRSNLDITTWNNFKFLEEQDSLSFKILKFLGGMKITSDTIDSLLASFRNEDFVNADEDQSYDQFAQGLQVYLEERHKKLLESEDVSNHFKQRFDYLLSRGLPILKLFTSLLGYYKNMRTYLKNFNQESLIFGLQQQLLEILSDLPFQKINKVLADYKIKLELIKKESAKVDPTIIGVQSKGSKPSGILQPKRLSFGEKQILDIISSFYQSALESVFDNKRVKVILLDEPDRHLDSTIISSFIEIIQKEFVEKEGVQVIMTTHRPDTVQLVPKDSIYMLEQDKETNISEIFPVERLHALYHLLKHLKQLTAIQLKVWTEAINDVYFYTAIYHCLLEFNEEQRERKQKTLIFKDLNGKEYERQLLSYRYLLSFVQVSDEKGNNGGMNRIPSFLVVDQRLTLNIKAKKENNLMQERAILDPRTFNSFAIVDNDGKREERFAGYKKDNIQDKIMIPKRSYSLENFLLNPFILCSSLSPEKAGEFVKYNLNDPQVKEELQKKFAEICQKISHELESISDCPYINLQNLQDYVDEYAEHMVEIININAGTLPKPPLETEDVNVLLLGGSNQVITIKYPKVLLEWRGHELFNRFMNVKESEFVLEFAKGLSQKKLKCIPQELADVLFDLNDVVKKTCKTPKIRTIPSAPNASNV